MKSKYSTIQEACWAGDFGKEYTGRNIGDKLVASNTALFSKILARSGPVSSVLELGSNIGQNLVAIHSLVPDAELTAVEINEAAAEQLRALGIATVLNQSLLDLDLDRTFDLVFTKGVLIHINPEHLPQVYETIHDLAEKHICLAEYYNPKPTAIDYRGRTDLLFKRDFAGDLLDRYDDLSLVDYGFVYHRDPVFPLDDISWFLMGRSK